MTLTRAIAAAITASTLALVGLTACSKPPTEGGALSADLKSIDLEAIGDKTGATFTKLRETHSLAAFEEAAANKDGKASALLGQAYYEGLGVEEDTARSADLFRQSCEADFPLGCVFHSFALSSGLGGKPEDAPGAVAALTKACDAGSPSGCNLLGVMYVKGEMVDANVSTAAGLFEKACKGGHAESCFNIGEQLLLSAKGDGADDPAALAMFNKACDGDYADGCHYAGLMYRKGQGAETDPDRTLKLLAKACSLGSNGACDDLKETRDILGIE